MPGYIGDLVKTEEIEAVKKISQHGGIPHTQLTVYIKKSIPGYPAFYCAVTESGIPEEFRGNDEKSLGMKALLYRILKERYPGKNAVIRFENEVNTKSLDESSAYHKAYEYQEDIKKSDIRRYITAYAVTRHYGGPEEGGWWYNHYEPIESVALPEELHIPDISDELEQRLWEMKEELYRKHEEVSEGNIYSVLGGVELSVLSEPVPNSNQTTGRPYYE